MGYNVIYDLFILYLRLLVFVMTSQSIVLELD